MRWQGFAMVCALACASGLAFAGLDNKGKPQSLTTLAQQAGPQKATPEQTKRREDYRLATMTKIRAAVQKSKKPMNAEMKALTQKHWRVSLRLLRVQRLAENTSKPAIAKRAVDALAKEDTRFFAKLDDLAKSAPPAASATGSAK